MNQKRISEFKLSWNYLFFQCYRLWTTHCELCLWLLKALTPFRIGSKNFPSRCCSCTQFSPSCNGPVSCSSCSSPNFILCEEGTKKCCKLSLFCSDRRWSTWFDFWCWSWNPSNKAKFLSFCWWTLMSILFLCCLELFSYLRESWILSKEYTFCLNLLFLSCWMLNKMIGQNCNSTH